MVLHQGSECHHRYARPREGINYALAIDPAGADRSRSDHDDRADKNYLPARMASRRFLIAAINSLNDLLNDSTPSCCRVSPTSLKSIPIAAKGARVPRASSTPSVTDARGLP